MMATTHGFAALAAAAVVAALVPESVPVLAADTLAVSSVSDPTTAEGVPASALVPAMAAGALVGGLAPDLDVFLDHRRSLHFPVYYPLLSVPAIAVAVLVPAPATVGLAAVLLGATLHTTMDVVGGPLAVRPWEGGSRAVYSHYHGRWLAPRRWIGYDGAPADLALSAVLAVPALIVFGAAIEPVVVAMLAVSVGYATGRGRVATLLERLGVAFDPGSGRR